MAYNPAQQELNNRAMMAVMKCIMLVGNKGEPQVG